MAHDHGHSHPHEGHSHRVSADADRGKLAVLEHTTLQVDHEGGELLAIELPEQR